MRREFEVTDGIIHGCPGLEIFNKTMSDTSKKTTVGELYSSYDLLIFVRFGQKARTAGKESPDVRSNDWRSLPVLENLFTRSSRSTLTTR